MWGAIAYYEWQAPTGAWLDPQQRPEGLSADYRCYLAVSRSSLELRDALVGLAPLDVAHVARVNAAEAEGQTRDAVRAARELLERGVSPERRDYDGWTPLALASIRGVRELAELVLDWGAEPCSADRLGYTPLHHASFHGHAPIVELLIGRGGRVSARSRVRSTPLLLAAARGRNRVIELLHAAGASVTVRNRRGWTPLSLARRQGHGGTVELLTRLGARE